MQKNRPQRQKENVRRVQELRRSNAAAPIPMKDIETRRVQKYGLSVLIDEYIDTDDTDPFTWR